MIWAPLPPLYDCYYSLSFKLLDLICRDGWEQTAHKLRRTWSECQSGAKNSHDFPLRNDDFQLRIDDFRLRIDDFWLRNDDFLTNYRRCHMRTRPSMSLRMLSPLTISPSRWSSLRNDKRWISNSKSWILHLKWWNLDLKMIAGDVSGDENGRFCDYAILEPYVLLDEGDQAMDGE